MSYIEHMYIILCSFSDANFLKYRCCCDSILCGDKVQQVNKIMVSDINVSADIIMLAHASRNPLFLFVTDS